VVGVNNVRSVLYSVGLSKMEAVDDSSVVAAAAPDANVQTNALVDDLLLGISPNNNGPLTAAFLKAKRMQCRCTMATRLAFMKHVEAISHAPPGYDVARCYTAVFHVFKDIAPGGLCMDDYEPHAREVLLTMLHGFCLRTGRALPVKAPHWHPATTKGGVTFELLMSDAISEEAAQYNDTEEDTRSFVGHRYRFIYYGNSDVIHRAAREAYNAASRRPINTAVTFTVEESVANWEPHDEAIRMAVGDNDHLHAKIIKFQNRTTANHSAAHSPKVFTLPSYCWIKHTRIDQFHTNAVLKYAHPTLLLFSRPK